jgi:hypothetical protein
MAGQWDEHHYRQERPESEEQKAGRIIPAGVAKAAWRAQDLPDRRERDMAKLRMARRLRRETTMTLTWIPARVHLGTWKHSNRRLSTAHVAR